MPSFVKLSMPMLMPMLLLMCMLGTGQKRRQKRRHKHRHKHRQKYNVRLVGKALHDRWTYRQMHKAWLVSKIYPIHEVIGKDMKNT